jgi:hypothetical protein
MTAPGMLFLLLLSNDSPLLAVKDKELGSENEGGPQRDMEKANLQ